MAVNAERTDAAEETCVPRRKGFLRRIVGRLKRSRRFWLCMLATAIVVLAARQWGSGRSVGIFLCNGGQHYVVIERGILSDLRFKGGSLEGQYQTTATLDRRAGYGFGRLSLSQHYYADRVIVDCPYVLHLFFEATLQPSKTHPGDWNLVNAGYYREHLWDPDFAMEWHGVQWWTVWKSIKMRLGFDNSTVYDPWERRLSATAMPSFLHRVDDQRLVDYFTVCRQEAPAEDCLELIERICADHPDDPYLMLHHMDWVAQCGDPERALEMWGRWKTLHAAHPDPLLQTVARQIHKNLLYAEDRANSDIEHFTAMFPPPAEKGVPRSTEPLERWEDWLVERSRRKHLQFRRIPLVLPDRMLYLGVSLWKPGNNGYLWQVPPSATVLSVFRMLRGDFDRSRDMMLGLYLLGHDLESQVFSLDTIEAGVDFRILAVQSLAFLVQNAPLVESELQALDQSLSKLAHLPHQAEPAELGLGQWSPLENHLGAYPAYVYDGELHETRRHFHEADGYFSMLQSMVRARLYRMRNGAWPEQLSQVIQDTEDRSQSKITVSSGTLAMQPFDGGLRFSVDFGKDAGSGQKTQKQRRISMELLYKRPYPFLREGIRANSAAELLACFPNGLPVDPFEDTFKHKAVSLSVLDATTTQPVIVASQGPNMGVSAGEDDWGDPIWGSGKKYRYLGAPWASPGGVLQPVFHHRYSTATCESSHSIPAILYPAWKPLEYTSQPRSLFVEIPPRKE